MMNPLILQLANMLEFLRRRWMKLRTQPDRGSTPEQVALIALFVLMAVTVGGIVTAKVVGAANGISLP